MIFITCTCLSVTGLISGNSLSQINEQFPTKFKAHPFAFKIWWFIYILFFIFVIYGFTHRNSWLIIHRIGFLFTFKSFAAMLWMYFYTANNIWLSTIFVWISWSIAIAIYIRLGIHYGDFGIGRLIPVNADDVSTKRPISNTEFWIIQAPFSLFFGWGTVCCISNVLTAVVKEQMKRNLNAWNTEEWAMESALLMTIVTLGVFSLLYSRNDYLVGFSVSWGFFWIAIQNWNDFIVRFSALFNLSAIVIGSLYTIKCILYPKPKKPPNKKSC